MLQDRRPSRRRTLGRRMHAPSGNPLGACAAGAAGGEGGMEGSVLDSTGAIISGATVTATNVATGIAISRKTASGDLYTISPIIPGKYTVTATAPGFAMEKQENLNVDALVMTSLNLTLHIGEQSAEVTVTEAPPQLDTTNATLGLTVENETFSNLPLQMNGAQRDPTAFGSLAPGAQDGSRLPIIGGTGNYLGQLYLDGLPAETVSQQGDNRLVSQAVSVDAIDQFQVVTSTPPAEFSGAGAENFTMRSGSLKYHGQVSDFIRNTIFDAWSFTAKSATVHTTQGTTVPAPKPVEHQNELSASFGGHVPPVKRLFFFVAYDNNAYSTANFSGSALSSGTASAPSGYSYASFLLGAVGGTPSIGLQPVSEEGGRYRPIAPFVEDNWKVSQKLTVDLGLRWDYLRPTMR
jgi:hypothetical protein